MTRLLQTLLFSTLFCITVLSALTESSDITTTQKPQQHHRRQHHRIHHKEHRRREHISERLTKTQELNEQIDLIDPKEAQPRVLNSTRIRPLTARDYYNRVVQRRQNVHRNIPTEWGYNTYNVLTNTFDTSPVGKSAGKGDDNMHDVEFISNNAGTSPEWAAPNPRRGYDYLPPMTPTTSTTTTMPITRRTLLTTSAPPPLVPVRRGYPPILPSKSYNDLPHVTEDPIETNIISRNPNDSKDMEK
ncbi:uncharacterized protein LOC119678834 [Teleopsis dalmanni]|nr:uncharacterized protein LOC119678834 [Teleopsis dalmanni]